MGRILATLAIGALLLLDLALPRLPRQGPESRVRADVPGAVGAVGTPLPDFSLPDLWGEPVRLSDLRGHRVLLTFERSLDW